MMRCPELHTNFDNERQLSVIDPAQSDDVPWYKLAPPRQVACPVCATPLRHRRTIMAAATAMGLLFVAAMCLKLLYPDNVAIAALVWLSVIAVSIGMPMLMRSRGYFRRGTQ